MTDKIKSSDLEAETQRLIEFGQMPSLDQVLAAVAEARHKYASLIVKARQGTENDAK